MLHKVFLTVMCIVLTICSLAAQRVEILGAGATFPEPLYSRMFAEYNRLGNHVNYQGIGSGGGINQLVARTVDFAGTDAIVAPDVEERSGDTILHVPVVLGAVVITYNLQLSENRPLRFTSDLIADIFLGNIRNWNDRRIAEANPGITMPNLPITVVHRADGSGTTFIFTEYLSKTNPTWADRIGFGTAVNWPTSNHIGERGNPGVAASINQTPGAIGYVELIYAMSNNIPYGDVRNSSGHYITPSMDAVSLAANVEMPADARVTVTDTAHERGYPISGFTWVLIFKEQNYNNRTQGHARAVVNLVRWMINEGQSYAPELHYAPLSPAAQRIGQELLNSVTYNGRPLN